jgi:hypothetical protein
MLYRDSARRRFTLWLRSLPLPSPFFFALPLLFCSVASPAFVCKSLSYIAIRPVYALLCGSALVALCRPSHTSSTFELDSPTRVGAFELPTGFGAHMQQSNVMSCLCVVAQHVCLRFLPSPFFFALPLLFCSAVPPAFVCKSLCYIAIRPVGVSLCGSVLCLCLRLSSSLFLSSSAPLRPPPLCVNH